MQAIYSTIHKTKEKIKMLKKIDSFNHRWYCNYLCNRSISEKDLEPTLLSLSYTRKPPKRGLCHYTDNNFFTSFLFTLFVEVLGNGSLLIIIFTGLLYTVNRLDKFLISVLTRFSTSFSEYKSYN